MFTDQNHLYQVVVAAVLMLMITGYFIYSLVRHKNRVLRWQQTRIKAEIDTLENERRRIAGDLHDELGPLLSAVKLQVNHLEPADPGEKAVLEKASQQIDEVIRRFREISYDLLPNTLVRKGVLKAVEEFISKLKGAHPVNIKFDYPAGLQVDKQKEVTIYRMIQEITHNTIKHAGAHNLLISLQASSSLIILHTKDDGCGFNYESRLRQGNGLGLMNLQSRVEVLNGQLVVTSQPGVGTEYYITLPI